MTPFPGSSDSTLLPPPAAVELTSEVKDKLAALAGEDPLPLPPRDRIRLLVQSPRRLYLYWSFRENPFAVLARTFPARAARFRFGVRLLDLTSDTTHFSPAGLDETGRAGEYWFDARPDCRYVAHVGFMSEANLFTRLLGSEQVRTPRLSVSPRAADETRFVSPPAEFGRVLGETGYVRDAIAFRVAEADAASGGTLPRTLFERLIGGEVLSARGVATDGLGDDMLRALLVALATGESLDRVDMPAELRARLGVELAGRDLTLLRREIIALLEFEIEESIFYETSDAEFLHWSSDSLGGSRVRVVRRRRACLPSLDHDLHPAFGSARVGASLL